MSERKLATVRLVSEIRPIPGADNIEVAVVDGWEVVVAKSEGWTVGAFGLYFEIDSWIPTAVAPFLTREGKEPKEYNGVKGERLRTVRLRGQLSQGLLVWMEKVLDLTKIGDIKQGDDYTQQLGIQKWELPEKTNTTGFNTKHFPTDLFPKTDQERVQNCHHKLPTEDTWEVTLKLDGSSCTIFYLDGKLRVCSRNLELPVYEPVTLTLFEKIKAWFGYPVNKKQVVKNPDNHFVKMALQVESAVTQADGYAFQGELMGPGIQENREGFSKFRWFVYDVVNVKTRKKLLPVDRRKLCAQLGLEHVPVLYEQTFTPVSVKSALEHADSLPSIHHKIAEGAVYKSNRDPETSFKAISNRYLLKQEQ
jgi:RNA ligase (TIGR02306 family)